MLQCRLLDRRSEIQPDGEGGAKNARKRGHENALLEVEFLDSFLFLFVGHLALLRHAGQAGYGNAGQADDDTGQNDVPPCRKQDIVTKRSLVDRRRKRADRGAVAQRHGHAERHAQVAHGEAERQSAEAPHRAPEISPEVNRERRLAEHFHQFRRHQAADDPRRDDPTENAAHQPIRLPRPALDEAKGHVETARGQAAEPVEEHAEKRIRTHLFGFPVCGVPLFTLGEHFLLVSLHLADPGRPDGGVVPQAVIVPNGSIGQRLQLVQQGQPRVKSPQRSSSRSARSAPRARSTVP